MSGDPVHGQSATARSRPAAGLTPAARPAAEQGITAAPGPKGDHVAVDADNNVSQCLSDGASADCAASLGTAVQSTKLAKVKKKNEKRRPTMSGSAPSSWPAAHELTWHLWGLHMHMQRCLHGHTAYTQTNYSTELLMKVLL